MTIVIVYVIMALMVMVSGNIKDIKRSIYCIIGAVTILAFFQVAAGESDLQVAFAHLNGLRIQGWSYFSNAINLARLGAGYFDGRPTLQVYFFLLSKLPINNFYAAISMAVTFYCMLMPIYKEAVRNDSNLRDVKTGIIILLLTVDVYSAMNGVRNIMAVMIFSYFLYMDLVENNHRKLCFIVYVLLCGFHPSVIVLLCFRLVLYLKLKRSKVIAFAVILLWNNFIGTVASALSKFGGIAIIANVVNKLTAYTTNTASSEIGYSMTQNAFNNSGFYMQMWYIKLAIIVVIAISILVIACYYHSLNLYDEILVYLCLFGLGATVSSVATNILTRYFLPVIAMYPVYILLPDNNKKIKTAAIGKFRIKLQSLIVILLGMRLFFLLFKYTYRAFELGFIFY